MSIPIRNLPVVQNWDCHTCGDCCQRLEGVITDEEKNRIEALDFANDTEIAPKPWFAPADRRKKTWRLKHRSGGGCVFLTKQNHCRIQELHGPEVKPFACRLFPFLLIPAGNHWRVGMRFSCPSVAANLGRPVTDSQAELVRFSTMLEHHVGRSADAAPKPFLNARQRLEWNDVCRLAEVLVEIVQDRRFRLERRLRICLALARICTQTQFDNLQGGRLTKYLHAVRGGMETDVPAQPEDLPPPDRLAGKVPFRVILAIYAQRDRDANKAKSIGRRIGRVLAGWKFARGKGRIPRVNEFLPEVQFSALDQPTNSPAEIDETLERYYAVKLNSLQFFGGPNFDMSILEGLDSLILTFPVIQWLRRSFADLPPEKAVEQAIQIVDDHFGGDAMLGLPHIRYLTRLIGGGLELERLVAWYGR